MPNPNPELIDQPSAAPTRKVTAGAAGAALVTSIVTAIIGILPESAGEEVRSAVTVLIDWAIGLALGALGSGLAGWTIRDRKVQPEG